MCLFSVACRNDDAKSNSKQTPKNKYVFRAMEPKQCSSGKLFRAGLYQVRNEDGYVMVDRDNSFT